MEQFDVVIIGSGLGGLECGVILSKEGMNVCVLEQGAVFGGCLQSFKRGGSVLDTGIHYVGSMGEGQILNQFFKYFGVLDSLKLRKLDEDAFDVIHLNGEKYGYAQSYERFYDTFASRFPNEREGLKRYCNKVKEIGSQINVEHLREGVFSTGGMEYFGVSGSDFIDSCVKDELLRSVLAGTNSLYGGIRGITTLYHHAMINHSNIEGAYRFADGTQAVADLLVDEIRKNGSHVRNNSKVVSILMDGEKVGCVELYTGEKIFGKKFISNIHPATTFDLLEKTNLIKKAYKSRLNDLPNSYGMFSAYLVMKPEKFPYINKNHYLFKGKDVWQTFTEDNIPAFTLLSCQARSANSEYCDVATLLCPMRFSEVEQWSGTKVERRGEDYKEFKEKKAKGIIEFADLYFPELANSIDKIYTTTPLSYLSYTSVPEGSAYGIVKNCHSPLATLIPARTKIQNLFLTGQNLNVHGAVGVTLTAAMTCSEIVGMEYLAKKIGNV